MDIVLLQFVNYTLSFLMWMFVGRIMLTLMIGERENIFLALFAKVTNPICRLVRRLLPFLPERWTIGASILLIIILRLLLIIFLLPAAPNA